MKTPPRLVASVPPLSAYRLIALLAACSAAHAQEAPAASAPVPTSPPPSVAGQPNTSNAPTTTDAQGNTVVKLSAFTVDASQDKGYFTANTLAGTRMNTNIGDLPSAITVVTKQQLEDTNSLNINDVFRYESNTEGARTYTPFVLVRGNLSDTLGGGGSTTGGFAGATAGGNRVRGLAAADNEEDNFFSLYRIPFDSYNANSLEIDRGPNSIIFGTGSPAGIINESRSQAVIDKTSAHLEFQGGSWGTFREVWNANIPIVPGKVAIFLGQVYNSQGFKQKPSSDIMRREYAAITIDPFKSHHTRIMGSFEYYNEYSNDPNGITPIDAVTPWLQQGRPVWNTLTDQVTYLNSGKTTQPYALSTTSPNYVVGGPLQANLTTSTSPFFIPAMTFFSGSHNIMFINQGNLENFYRGQQTGFSISGYVPTTLTSAQALVNEERLAESTTLPTPSQYASYYLPGVTSKSIYDWSTINLNSVDNTSTSAKTYYVDFQQDILPGLNLDVAWFRQELNQLQDSPLSQASATTLAVDTSAYLPNGAPNPHVGQPFLDVYASDVYSEPEINNNYRAMLAYTADLSTKASPWINWIGKQRFLVSFSQHDDITTNLRYRPAIDGGDPNYLPTTASLTAATGYSYAASNSALEQVLYLGGDGNPDGHGTSSAGFFNRPGYGGPTVANITTYNYATGTWQTSQLHMDSPLFATGGLSENLQDSKTYFWQSFFWKDRIVGSLGMNQDQVKNRNTIFPTTNPTAVEYTNGMANTQYWYDEGPWSYVGGNTSTLGLVLHPFKNWSWIDSAANQGNLVAAFARTIGLTFNKSDNFNPPAGTYTDYFGNQLGKPAGKEKDYGFEIATPDNKLFLRATFFNTTNLNQVVSLTSNTRANYIDQTELKNWATAVVEIRNGELPSDPNFGNTSVYPITLAEQGQISSLTGLPYTYGGNVGANGEYVAPTATENGQAKGIDLELTYNPLPNWTMKFTWGKQQTTVTGAGAQGQAWVNYRMPYWLKATASDLNQVYTKSDGTPMYLGNFWQAYGFDSNVTANSASGWTTTQNYYNSVVGSALAVDEANNGGLAPNQREYSWTYLTNYIFDRGMIKGVGIGGAFHLDGRAVAGYYGNLSNLNSTGQIAAPNIDAPIYTPAKAHIDAWVSYGFHLPWANGRIRGKVQFNVADLTSNGYLLPVSYNFDGTPAAERIIPPRQYTVSTKFDY